MPPVNGSNTGPIDEAIKVDLIRSLVEVTDSATGTGAVNHEDVVVGVEKIVGGAGADTFIGDGNANIFEGKGGVDKFVGGAGDDTFIGDDTDHSDPGDVDNPTFNGGDGEDTVELNIAVVTLTDVAAKFKDVENLRGGASVNELTGDEKANKLYGEGDGDTLNGEGGDDMLVGGAGADILKGGAGADMLDGGDANDDLNGEGGDDTLDGGAGNDKLIGGAGNDMLTGGGGEDCFSFSLTTGLDTVSDFDPMKDTLHVDGATTDNLSVNGSGILINTSTTTPPVITQIADLSAGGTSFDRLTAIGKKIVASCE